MNRIETGARLLQWSGGVSDPIFQVGCSYLSGQVVPDRTVVELAVQNLIAEITMQLDLLDPPPITTCRIVWYTDEELEDNIGYLVHLTDTVQQFIKSDYRKAKVMK